MDESKGGNPDSGAGEFIADPLVGALESADFDAKRKDNREELQAGKYCDTAEALQEVDCVVP